MRFLKAVAVGALALVNVALAQANLAFTTVPPELTAGQVVTIMYRAQNLNQPATITLRKGNPANLEFIAILTSNALHGTFTWIPPPGLADASDYALQITQGDQVNYSAPFVLTGSDPAAVADAQAATASGLSSLSALTASAVSSLQSVIASYNCSLANLTAPVTLSTANATVVGTLGTGIPMTRNATFSPASLTGAAAPVATTTARMVSSATGSTAAVPTSGVAVSAQLAEGSVLALFGVALLFFLQ